MCFYLQGDVKPAMTTISNLANRALDPTTDDEVRSFCEENKFLTLRRTVVSRHFLSLIPTTCSSLSFLRRIFPRAWLGNLPSLYLYIFWQQFLFLIFGFCVFFKDHIVTSAAGHFALKRLINQDKDRLQSGNTGKQQKLCSV